MNRLLSPIRMIQAPGLMDKLANGIGWENQSSSSNWDQVPSDQTVAFTLSKSADQQVTVTFPEDMELFTCPPKAKAFLIPRNVTIQSSISVEFQNGEMGRVELQFNIRLAECEDMEHPFLRGKVLEWSIGSDQMAQIIADALGETFTPSVLTFFSNANYDLKNWTSKQLHDFLNARHAPLHLRANHGFLLNDLGDDVSIRDVASQEGDERIQTLKEWQRNLSDARSKAEIDQAHQDLEAKLQLSKEQSEQMLEMARRQSEHLKLLEEADYRNKKEILIQEKSFKTAQLESMKRLMELDEKITVRQKQEAAIQIQKLATAKNQKEIRELELHLEQAELETKLKALQVDGQKQQNASMKQVTEDHLQSISRLQLAIDAILQSVSDLNEQSRQKPQATSTPPDQASQTHVQAWLKPRIRWSAYRWAKREDGSDYVKQIESHCEDGSELRSGDALRVNIIANTNAWFYVFNLGKYPDTNVGRSRYRWHLLFGNDCQNDAKYSFERQNGNFMGDDEQLLLPSESICTEGNTYWPLDQNPCNEIFYVIATRQQLDESVIQKIRDVVMEPTPLPTRGIPDANQPWGPTSSSPLSGATPRVRMRSMAQEGLRVLRDILGKDTFIQKVMFYHI